MKRIHELAKWLMGELWPGDPDPDNWTIHDERAAYLRGWGLFDVGGWADGWQELQLQATDERPDGEVWLEVVQRAEQGDRLAQKALRILAKNNEVEAIAIKHYVDRKLKKAA